jgi:hypothetical protein
VCPVSERWAKPGIPFEFVNPLREPQWNRMILEPDGATFFHTAEWARVLVEAYRYRPQYVVLSDAGRIWGILPMMEVRSLWTGRRGVCLPFSDECGPLVSNGATIPELIAPARERGLKSGWSYIELRGGGETLPGAVGSAAFVTHDLSLEASQELQFGKLRDSTRRNIMKSIREGVEVEQVQSRDGMDAFYALHCQTRRRHGVPPQPARFFHLIHRIVIEPGLGFVSLARFKRQYIAGAVFFRFGSRAIYKFGASDRNFHHLRANNLVMWNAIDQFRREGLVKLTLGRTDLSDEGLLQFKRGWGATESKLRYHRIGLRRKVRPTGPEHPSALDSLARSVVRFTPLPLLRAVGSVVYRHIA